MRISDWSSDVCSSDLGMAAAAGPGAHAQRAPARRKAGAAGPPNVIILITDQTSAGLTKRSGYKFDTSPTLDRLAANGVDFRRAYCTIPACVPSRASMLTGRWPQATRVRMNLRSEEHTSELQSLMRISYAVLCLKKKNN